MTACAADPFVIVQIADAQLGFTAAEVSQREGTEYVNDLTYETECLKKAVEMINDIRPDVVVFTGDQVNHAADKEQWTVFADIVSGISKTVKVFHLPGNHDVFINEGNVDSTPFTSRFGEDRFVYAERGVRLVGINSNLIKYNDPQEEGQKIWLEDALGKNGDEVDAIVWNILDHPDSSSPTYEADLKEYNTKLKYYRDLGYMSETSIVAIFIKYNHNNKEYITELGYFSPEIRIGQSVKILVSKDDSTDFIVKEKKHFALIFCLITGSIGLVGGVLFLFANKHNSKVIDYLKQTGTLYECEILFVDEDEKKVSFERHPFIFTVSVIVNVTTTSIPLCFTVALLYNNPSISVIELLILILSLLELFQYIS